jgi:hypothetical protein
VLRVALVPLVLVVQVVCVVQAPSSRNHAASCDVARRALHAADEVVFLGLADVRKRVLVLARFILLRGFGRLLRAALVRVLGGLDFERLAFFFQCEVVVEVVGFSLTEVYS